MSKYRCKRCNFLYIDEQRDKSFKNLEEDWKCPRCHCSKKMFECIEK